MHSKGMALIEFLIAFLLLSMLVACFLKASIVEQENARLNNAKQEQVENQVPQVENHEVDATADAPANEGEETQPSASEERSVYDVERELEQAEPQMPQTTQDGPKKDIPQFVEILD